MSDIPIPPQGSILKHPMTELAAVTEDLAQRRQADKDDRSDIAGFTDILIRHAEGIGQDLPGLRTAMADYAQKSQSVLTHLIDTGDAAGAEDLIKDLQSGLADTTHAAAEKLNAFYDRIEAAHTELEGQISAIDASIVKERQDATAEKAALLKASKQLDDKGSGALADIAKVLSLGRLSTKINDMKRALKARLDAATRSLDRVERHEDIDAHIKRFSAALLNVEKAFAAVVTLIEVIEHTLNMETHSAEARQVVLKAARKHVHDLATMI